MANHPELEIRVAVKSDLPALVELDRITWGEDGAATYEMFESSIRVFPEGIFAAVLGSKIVGVVVTEIVNYDLVKDAFTWYEISDNGFIKKTHNPKGDTLYGVNLSIHPSYQNRGIGQLLLARVGKLAIDLNLAKGILGARIPAYHKYADRISASDYVKIDKVDQKTGISQDPELVFYLRDFHGSAFEVVKVIPGYFRDPESVDFGVLICWRNKHRTGSRAAGQA